MAISVRRQTRRPHACPAAPRGHERARAFDDEAFYEHDVWYLTHGSVGSKSGRSERASRRVGSRRSNSAHPAP